MKLLFIIRARDVTTAQQTGWMGMWLACSSSPPKAFLMDVNCVIIMLKQP